MTKNLHTLLIAVKGNSMSAIATKQSTQIVFSCFFFRHQLSLAPNNIFNAAYMNNKLILSIADFLGLETVTKASQPIMDFYKIPGTVRSSLAFYNTKEEIDIFVEAVERARQMLR